MSKRIIVTGGAGFIGSHIAKHLLSLGYRVLILDNLATGYLQNIPGGAEFMEIDISDGKALDKIPDRNIEAVLHLAAQSSGEISFEKPIIDITSNAVGTLVLLKWCKNNNIKRFIISSSMAVYGQPEPDTLPAKETDICRPLSLYGISKLTAENYVNFFYNEGINTTIFRLFSVYGPGQDLNNMKQGMVSIYFSYILKNQTLTVKGAKDRFRDLIYINDVVNAVIKSIDSPVTFGKTYNLGTGKKTLVEELVNLELKLLGKDPNNYPVEYKGSTPNDQFGVYADISKIKADLNWQPQFSLDAGLKEMVEWAKI